MQGQNAAHGFKNSFSSAPDGSERSARRSSVFTLGKTALPQISQKALHAGLAVVTSLFAQSHVRSNIKKLLYELQLNVTEFFGNLLPQNVMCLYNHDLTLLHFTFVSLVVCARDTKSSLLHHIWYNRVTCANEKQEHNEAGVQKTAAREPHAAVPVAQVACEK
jgi:hypothetical protein